MRWGGGGGGGGKGAALAGAGLAASGAFTRGIAEDISAIDHPDQQPTAPKARKTMKGVPFERTANVRVGIVGTGLRGRSVLNELLGDAGFHAEKLATAGGY